MTKVIDLDSIPLLRGIDSNTRIFLEKKMRLTQFVKNSLIMMDGDDSHDLFFLLKGKLNIVTTTSDGRMIPLASLLPGNYFGELSVIDQKPRSATVIASEPSTVAVLLRKDALQLIEISPVVGLRMMKHMADMIRKHNQFRTFISINSTPKRIYNYLLHESQSLGDDLAEVKSLPKQAELASILNVSRESISRAINQLIKNGVIKKTPERILVLSRKKLQALSEED